MKFNVNFNTPNDCDWSFWNKHGWVPKLPLNHSCLNPYLWVCHQGQIFQCSNGNDQLINPTVWGPVLLSAFLFLSMFFFSLPFWSPDPLYAPISFPILFSCEYSPLPLHCLWCSEDELDTVKWTGCRATCSSSIFSGKTFCQSSGHPRSFFLLSYQQMVVQLSEWKMKHWCSDTNTFLSLHLWERQKFNKDHSSPWYLILLCNTLSAKRNFYPFSHWYCRISFDDQID